MKASVPAPARPQSQAAGCNNNWDTWGVGSRLQWDVTKSFYIGVEAIYQQASTVPRPGWPAMR